MKLRRGIGLTIGEILKALKQGKSLADIGKELTVGKEKLSKILKDAGYVFNRRTGWTFTRTDQEPLNKDYTDFITPSKSVKKPTNIPTKKQTNVGSKIVLKESTKERTNVIRKRSSFDIDIELMKNLKIQAVIHDKNVYEIVENAIRKELAELKNMK
ncbi:hypothetical protein AAP92_004639 [Salmonella enterica subsp. enterica serovar Enteritidis]|nr:hypothetical protein [Salmonella enterica subsp. enterica serovar Enteritidis]